MPEHLSPCGVSVSGVEGMTQPSLEERWWDLVHRIAIKLNHRAEGVADRVCGMTWGLQRSVYYRWAALVEDRVQSEPPVGDVCGDCGWSLTIRKVPGPVHNHWWEARCKQCDLFVIGGSPTMAVDKFGKLLLVRSTGLGGLDEGEADGQ